jgi:hypothetical protein
LICAVIILGAGQVAAKTGKSDKPADPRDARHEVVRQVADELISGLRRAAEEARAETARKNTLSTRLKEKAAQLKRWWRDEKPKPASGPAVRRLAIWPFWKDKSVVSEDFAEMLSDSLLAELVRRKDPNDRYVAREDLKIVSKDIDEFNQLRQSSEKMGKLIREAGADILIIGEVKPEVDGKTVYVRYRATDARTGAIPATSGWYRVEYDFDRTATMGIADAVKRSALFFRQRLKKMRTVRPQGVRFGESGIQTPFGKWFAARLVNELQKTAGAAGQTINVADAILSKETRTRGLKLARKAATSQMAATPTGDYIFSGRYWVLGEKVDLQLAMKDGSGKTMSWQGDVRSSSIDLPMKPKKTFAKDRQSDKLGPISLHIGSDRGPNPIYHLKQKMNMFIEVSRDSYLYCFYRQADGVVMRVFPNRYHESAFISGGAQQRIPSAAMAFEWVFSPPIGTEMMKCYAFDRDVGEALPRLIRKLDFEPLPYGGLDEVTAQLRSIRGVGIAENSMVVNVER